MNKKMKNVLSIVLAVIIAFMVVKFTMHTVFANVSQGNRLAISAVSMFVIFIVLMFVFNKLFKNM